MVSSGVRQAGHGKPLNARARWAASRLDYQFNDPTLLEQALTHRSASKTNNERLEFLGDALLNFVVADVLYALRPNDPEGDLSRARAALVRKATLASIGRELGIDSELVLGRGEIRAGGAQRGAALADALEAVIGAVFIDGGFDAARALVERLFAQRFETLPAPEELKDAKTRLQEWLQARGLGLPSYRVESVSGSDHEKQFVVACALQDDSARTEGSGASRRRAEQNAAAAMLADLTRGG